MCDFIDKKVIIYGVGRFRKDFLYIFDKLNIKYSVTDNEQLVSIEKKVKYFKCLEKENKNNYVVVVCEYNKEDAINNLENMGYVYKKNYWIAEDLFQELDKKYIQNITEDLFGTIDHLFFEKIRGKKLVIWGTGNYSSELIKANPQIKIDYFIDSNSKITGKLYNGKTIKHPDMIQDWKNIYIIIATINYYYEIRDYLIEVGLKENIDFALYRTALHSPFKTQKPSEMLLKTIYDKPLKKRNCFEPFSHIEVNYEGGMCLCCPNRIEIPGGYLYKVSFNEAWTSIVSKIIRLSMINRTFSFCNKNNCPNLNFNDEIMNRDNIICEDDYKMKQTLYPEHINIGIDNSCNLKCTTCRNKMKVANKEEKKRINIIADKLLEVVPYTKTLVMAGNGEIFFNECYKKIWIKNENEAKRDTIYVISNGILFNAENWNKLKQSYNNIKLTISVDASTKKTYDRIRRGGDFNKLIKNLKYASMLRKSGELKFFQLNYVIQSLNCFEMDKFVMMAKKFNADRVYFTRVMNWGTYSTSEFEKISLFDNKDRVKDKYIELFKSSILKDPIVDLSFLYNFTDSNGEYIIKKIVDE